MYLFHKVTLVRRKVPKLYEVKRIKCTTISRNFRAKRPQSRNSGKPYRKQLTKPPAVISTEDMGTLK